MKRSYSSSTQEDTFISEVLLTKDINGLVSSFSSPDTFLFTGTICKDWTPPMSKKTNMLHVFNSASMMGEYLEANILGDVHMVADLMRRVAKYGNLKCLVKIHACYEETTGEKFPWDDQCIRETYKDSDEFYEDLTFRNILGIAASRGNLRMLKWLEKSGCRFSNHFSEIEYMHTYGGRKYEDSGVISYAFENFLETGNGRIIIWLLDNSCPVKLFAWRYWRYFIESDMTGEASWEEFSSLASFKGNASELLHIVSRALNMHRVGDDSMAMKASSEIDRTIRDWRTNAKRNATVVN